MNRWLRAIIKAIAGMAVIAFLLANPFNNRNEHIVAFFISVPVLLICFLAWGLLDRYGADSENGSN